MAKASRKSGVAADRSATASTPPSVATFTNPELATLAPALRSLTETAAFWLRRDIVRGVLKPMDRLKVEHLAKFYKIGRSPVQAAIMILEPGGLVSHEHQKGHRVAPISLADYDDLLDVYRDLYVSALRKAVARGDQSWEERVIVTLHRTMRITKVLDAGSEGREMWQLAYKRLHSEILSGCGSPLMMTILSDLGNRVERYVNLFGDAEADQQRDHHQEHKALVDVLLERHPDQVVAEFDRYFRRNQPMRDTIVEALRRIDEKPARRAAKQAAVAPREKKRARRASK